jgi:hypothetical protein
LIMQVLAEDIMNRILKLLKVASEILAYNQIEFILINILIIFKL